MSNFLIRVAKWQKQLQRISQATEDTTNENSEAVEGVQMSQEQFDELLGKIDQLETKLSESTKGDDYGQPKDLESALSKIAELESKLAKQTDGSDSTETELSEKVAELQDRIDAITKHSNGSSDDSVSGDGNDNGQEKKSFASMFRYRGDQQSESATN